MNIAALSSLTGHTVLYSATTVLASTGVANPNGSGRLVRLSCVIAAFVGSSNSADISLAISRGGSPVYLGKTLSIAKQTRLVLLERSTPLYLEEGDTLVARASANSTIDLTIAYEEISP